jgi:3-oxoadipate CoA-transferase alpha subunit
MIDKTVRNVAEALAGVQDGAVVLIGGFGSVGEPVALIEGLIEQGARDLTLVGIHAGIGADPVARLVGLGRVRRVIVSWTRSSSAESAFGPLFRAGGIELELVPQGTLAERIRAAGAGVPAFFTATAAGTMLAAGKEVREIGGREYVLEQAIHADLALIEAWEGDRWGNLTYRRAGRNLNPVMATAAEMTVAQVQHLRTLGEIDPDHVVTPGIFVQRVLHLPYGDPPF